MQESFLPCSLEQVGTADPDVENLQFKNLEIKRIIKQVGKNNPDVKNLQFRNLKIKKLENKWVEPILMLKIFRGHFSFEMHRVQTQQ